jgi:hypothetical protein
MVSVGLLQICSWCYLYVYGLFNRLKPSGSVCTTRFKILKLCILPEECVCVFRVVLTVNSDCCPKQHYPVDHCSGDNVSCEVRPEFFKCSL